MTAAGTATTATIGMTATTTTAAAGMAMIAAGAMTAIERHCAPISCIKQLRRPGVAACGPGLVLSYAGLL